MKIIGNFLRWFFQVDKMLEIWEDIRRVMAVIFSLFLIGASVGTVSFYILEPICIRKYPIVFEGQEESTRYIINPLTTTFHADILDVGDIVETGANIPVRTYDGNIDSLNIDFLPVNVPFVPDHASDSGAGRIRAKRGDVVDYKSGTVYINDEEVLSGVLIDNPYGEFPYTLKRGEYLVLPDLSDIPEKARTSKRAHAERIDGKHKRVYSETSAYGVRRISDITGTLYELPNWKQYTSTEK